jgi:hypothetical protein
MFRGGCRTLSFVEGAGLGAGSFDTEIGNVTLHYVSGSALTHLRVGQYTALAHFLGSDTMLISRDYVGYMAGEVVKRLLDAKMIEAPSATALTQRVRATMQDEISVEDRLNEEVREILTKHAEDMRKAGASYQEMYKKVKGELARQRKLILR